MRQQETRSHAGGCSGCELWLGGLDGRQGEPHGEGAAVSLLALDAELPTVLLYNLSGARQAQPVPNVHTRIAAIDAHSKVVARTKLGRGPFTVSLRPVAEAK